MFSNFKKISKNEIEPNAESSLVLASECADSPVTSPIRQSDDVQSEVSAAL